MMLPRIKHQLNLFYEYTRALKSKHSRNANKNVTELLHV